MQVIWYFQKCSSFELVIDTCTHVGVIQGMYAVVTIIIIMVMQTMIWLLGTHTLTWLIIIVVSQWAFLANIINTQILATECPLCMEQFLEAMWRDSDYVRCSVHS